MAYEVTCEDLILARYPGWALFFAFLAPFVYAFIVFGLAGTFIPGVAEAARGEGENVSRITWTMQLLLQFVLLIHVSLWAERVGVGPFAGKMYADQKWFAIGIFGAPILQTVVIVLAFAMLSNGESDWAYRSEADRDFITQAAIGPVMIVSLLVLAPLVEEVCLRGIALGCLLGRGVPAAAAVIIQAACFAALHLQYKPAAMLSVFVLGLFLGWLRLTSKSITVPILAHVAVNLQAVVGLSNAGV